MKSLHRYISIVLVGMVALTLLAQPILYRDAFVINHLSSQDGLDNMRVFSILQGPKGEMWISTRDGINRYNSSVIENYHLESDRTSSNAAGRMISLYQDTRKRLFAFDNAGDIYEYNDNFGRFVDIHHLYQHFDGDIKLNRIYADGDVLWLAMRRGVYLYQNEQPKPLYNKDEANDMVRAGLYMAVGLNHGVALIDYAHKGHPVTIIPGSTPYNIQSIYYDEDTRYLWMGTLVDGIHIYDIAHRRWIDAPQLQQIPTYPIRAFARLDNYTILAGIDGAGVYKIDRKTLAASLFLNAEDQTGNALTGNGIYTLCVDRDQNLWMGSYTGGVDVAYPRAINVQFFHHEYKNNQSLLNNTVNDVCETPDGTLWFATNIGLSAYQPKTGNWHHSLSGKVVLTLTSDGAQGVYAGTYGDGVYRVSGGMAASKTPYPGEYITALVHDKDGDLWIGNIEHELICVHQGQAQKMPLKDVQSLALMPDGHVAAGTPNGFYVMNKQGQKPKAYFINSEFHGQDINSFVKSMIFSDNHTAWIGTDGGGVYVYDMRSHRIIQHFTTTQRLPSNSVASLLQDKQGHIFVATDKGISMVSRDKKWTVKNLSMVKGIEQEYNRMSCELLHDGRIAFGGNEGVVIMDTRNIGSLRYQAKLNITRLTPALSNEELTDETRQSLHEMLLEGNIHLSHAQNTFEIDVECINYRFQHDIAYEYQLEGFDEHPLSMNDLHSLRYANIPPGDYTLHIKAISKTDGHVIDSKDIDISVAHPWYSSPLARLIYFLIFAGIVWLIWRTYRNRLEKRYYDDKISFFVNTAHDIRTPLSLVLAPLNDLAQDTELSAHSKKFLDMARRNGDKLMMMITQLLDFQKFDTQHMNLNIQQLPLATFLQQQIERFQPLATKKQQYLTIGECAEREVWIDQNLMETILDNLLSNAIKYTPEGGEITVYTQEIDGQLALSVKDTGIGIPKKDQEGIFGIFYRAANALTSKQMGTGLGLMITHRLAEKMDAHLTFESKEGEGTTFTLMPIPTKPVSSMITEHHTDENNENESAAQDAPHAALLDRSEPGTSNAKTKDHEKDTLLFVDDNEELRAYVHMAFDDYYDITTAESGEKALEFFAQGGVCDIVVSDVMMPGIQGNELCHRIKENAETSWLPVILLTAKSGKSFMINGLELGADDYITKPFDPEILRSKIDSMLANRRRMSKYYLEHALNMVRGTASAETEEGNAERLSGDLQNSQLEEQNLGKQTASPSEAQERLQNNQPAATDEPELNPADQEFIDKATHLVLTHISEEDFDINHLCREMAMSRTLFYGRLKTLTGKTPQEFIRLIRLEQAMLLLQKGHAVSDTATRTGFVNAKYFATIFKKHFGISPSQVSNS